MDETERTNRAIALWESMIADLAEECGAARDTSESALEARIEARWTTAQEEGNADAAEAWRKRAAALEGLSGALRAERLGPEAAEAFAAEERARVEGSWLAA